MRGNEIDTAWKHEIPFYVAGGCMDIQGQTGRGEEGGRQRGGSEGDPQNVRPTEAGAQFLHGVEARTPKSDISPH